eukprot:gene7467-8296_t
MPLENYLIDKVIGKGSYGEVSLAKHKKDKKQYVIKKIDLHGASEKERNFSEQEVQILAKLRHPNIVSYKESFQTSDGFLHIVMGYCEGGDLYTKLKEYGKRNEYLSERQIVEWFVQIAMALQYMHDRNILHRDLKTQNIFLTKSKIIKIGDLGIARVLESTSDMATTLIGTPYYMSPELFSNKPYNHRSDVWALGCCVYEMATLKHAFNARNMNSLVYKILKGKTPPMPKQYSEDLCSIIKSMLAYNPSERPSASKILRHPFVKEHIAIFLQGTKSRKEVKEKRSNSTKSKSTVASSTDSNLSGSSEANEQAIATASGVDLDILNEDRKEKYIVAEEGIEEDKSSRKLVKKVSKERTPKQQHRDTDAKGKGAAIEVVHEVKSVQWDEKPSGEQNERRKQMREKEVVYRDDPTRGMQRQQRRVRSAESKDQIAAKPESGKDRKYPASHSNSPFDKQPVQVKNPRPLPPAPVDASPSYQGRDRSNTDPGASGDELPSQVALNQQPACGPNISARQKRRMRINKEGVPTVARKTSNPKLEAHPHKHAVHSKPGRRRMVDSVDGPLKSQPDEDSNSDAEDKKQFDDSEPSSPSAGREPCGDIADLIGTMRSLDQRPSSARSATSSPEESLQEPESLEADHRQLSSTLSGRLNDRIERLRRECIRGIGEVLLKDCFAVLNQEDDDELECGCSTTTVDEWLLGGNKMAFKLQTAFIGLLGTEKYELFGDAIRQLKFCEEFAQHPM